VRPFELAKARENTCGVPATQAAAAALRRGKGYFS